MQGEASNIIRTIRQKLGMSQAEFARTLGWGTSTISRWESGKAEPNRLAMKIILAFGEERGVRYRPRVQTLPEPVAPSGARGGGVPMLAVPVARPASGTWSTSMAGERAGWEAQLSFRVAIDRGSGSPRTTRRAWLSRAVAGGALCTALIGIALMTAAPAKTGRDPSARRPPPSVLASGTLAAAPAAAPTIDSPRTRAEARRSRSRRRPAAPVPDAPIVSAPVEIPAPRSPPRVLARLEGVTLLGGARTATFRTDGDSITLSEGQDLGTRHAERVGVDGVDLRDATGSLQTVKLGDSIAIE